MRTRNTRHTGAVAALAAALGLVVGLTLVLGTGCAGSPEVKKTPQPGPGSKGKGAAPADEAPPEVPKGERWRAERPEPGSSLDVVVPKIERTTLSNGLTVMVSERHDVPVVEVQVAVRAGGAVEPRGKGGLADLTYEAMLEGTGKLDGVALDQAFADLGTAAAVSTENNGASFHVTVLSRHTDAALGLLAGVVRRPRLAGEDFERLRKKALANLARNLGSPQFLQTEALRAAVYGPNHPYGQPVLGTQAGLAGLKLNDIKGFHRRHVGPRAAAVIFAGDITLSAAKDLARKHFGNWRGPARPAARVPEVAPSPREAVVVVPKPGLGQTFIALGRPLFGAGHPDEWALGVANAVFGGMFSSRLNMNLREDKGYTYGARSSVDTGHGAGALSARTPVQADKTGAALKEVIAELEGIAARPITEQELALARDGVLRAVPGWFETASSTGSTMARQFYLDLPPDRLQKMVDAYEALTLERVREAAARYLVPGVMRIVLVGDPTVIAAQVGPMELGKLVERMPHAADRP